VVSGLPEYIYPKKKRILYYVMSFIDSLPLLILTSVLKIIIFNLNGLIDDEK
jgi:hypothetical protein